MTSSEGQDKRVYAVRDSKKLESDVKKRIDQALLELARDPRPRGNKKLEPKHRNRYRIHVGRDWVIVYEIDDAAKLVEVVSIADRKEAY